MPVSTRSKAQLGQSLDCVTSSRVNPPRRLVVPRQGKAVVTDFVEDGSPSNIVANGEKLVASFGISKCSSNRCMTCPKLVFSKQFTSNVTHKTYDIINHTSENLSCHSQNLVYLLTCSSCNLQYVGETTIPLHRRINIHRTSKTGCEHMINHYKEVCVGSHFTVQIIEYFSGTGYINNDPCPDARKIRLDREDYWMKTLRTIYPYGLNDRARKTNQTSSVGSLFPSIPQLNVRRERSRKNNKQHIHMSENNFFEFVNTEITNTKNAYFNIKNTLMSLRKKVLKKVASSIMLETIEMEMRNKQFFDYIADIIDTKLYKSDKSKTKFIPNYICSLKFDNKSVESIHLSKIFRNPEVISLLPEELQKDENIPVVTYILGSTIRNKILNYKDTVNSILVNDEHSPPFDSEPCDCSQSEFCNPDHQHIITGDLRIIENNKLRKLLTKGPNYREPRSLNFGKAEVNIKSAIISLIDKICLNPKYDKVSLLNWKTLVLNKVKERIKTLKRKHQPRKTKPILSEPDVVEYLKSLQHKFVIVTIDKAANNFAFVCKRFYISRLLLEVGVGDSGGTQTYSRVIKATHEIISENKSFCKEFGLDLTEEEESLPIMYWMPKMHKSPVGFRFIVASKMCSTKPLTKVISRVFKLIYMHIESFHRKNKFYSHYNKFWVVQNTFPIIDRLNKLNSQKKAKSISTFDFSTLYTTIPHHLLVQILSELIEIVFDFYAKDKKYRLGFSNTSLYFTTRGTENRYFTKSSLKDAVSFLIQKCYFTIGNLAFKQDIGIPMGIDPAPFWANLFLYKYEKEFVDKLISEKSTRAYLYGNTGRFIDDLCAINDRSDFKDSHKQIYPEELELKLEHSGLHATFLDLDITIQENIFVYKLFDKRDKFPFFIVRMPHLDSNIPSNIFYGAFFSETLRIARCSLLKEDFVSRMEKLLERMTYQGGCLKLLLKQIHKAYARYPTAFKSFNCPVERLIFDII